MLFTALTSLFVGQTIYLIWSGRMRVPLGLALLLAWWVVGEWAMQTHSTKFIETNAVAVWRLLTYLGFAVLLAFEDRLIVPRSVAFIAATSYSVYLLQEPFGWTPLEFTTSAIGYPLALVLAIVMTLVASSLCYILVERPSQKMARALIRHQHPRERCPVPSRSNMLLTVTAAVVVERRLQRQPVNSLKAPRSNYPAMALRISSAIIS